MVVVGLSSRYVKRNATLTVDARVVLGMVEHATAKAPYKYACRNSRPWWNAGEDWHERGDKNTKYV